MDKKQKDKISEYLTLTTKALAIYVGLAYASGFLIWNIYLQSLGFYPDLVQGRFVLTGTLFILVTMTVFGFVVMVKEGAEKLFARFGWNNCCLLKADSEYSKFARFYFTALISLLYLIVFSFFAFPLISGPVGGDRPRLISIIGDPQEIAYLENFGIGEASPVETGIVCSAYEDNNYMVIVLADRILSLKKDMYKGFVSLPNKDEDKYISECGDSITLNFMRWKELNMVKQ